MSANQLLVLYYDFGKNMKSQYCALQINHCTVPRERCRNGSYLPLAFFLYDFSSATSADGMGNQMFLNSYPELPSNSLYSFLKCFQNVCTKVILSKSFLRHSNYSLSSVMCTDLFSINICSVRSKYTNYNIFLVG